MRIEQFDM